MRQTFIIIGYYNHKNSGDELYSTAFNYIIKYYLNFNEYDIQFIDCDTLKDPIKNNIIKDDDIVIIGGGDVLNNYFLDTIINFFNNKKNVLHAVSVGIPYLNIITSNKLAIFNTIFLRTRQDISILKNHYKKIHIEYIPDASYFISKNRIETPKRTTLSHITKKKVAICLSRNIYNIEYISLYQNVIKQLVNFVKHLLSINYHIVFIPFNTNSDNNTENDILIADDILNELHHKINNDNIYTSITHFQETLNEYEILDIFSQCDVVIPMRYHACLLSIYANKPFLPIYSTRKINNLLKDISWNYGYKLSLNEKDIPIDINLIVLIYRFNNLINDQQQTLPLLKNINDSFDVECNVYKQIVLIDTSDNTTTKSSGSVLIDTNTTIDKIEFIKNKVNQYLYTINTKFSIDNLYEIKDSKIQNIIIQIISFYITNGTTQSIYNHGLKEKLFNKNYDINKEWMWVIENEKKCKETKIVHSNPNGLFNLNYIDQTDYEKVHRSGWGYVYDNLKHFHNSDSDLLLDLYIDKTFHWDYEINKILNIIPYTKRWCGFIHHTFDQEFSNYNCYNLLTNNEFLKSLEYCNGLFVLSNYLKNQLINELKKLNLNIPVYSFIHPTETNVQAFTLEQFISNNNKNIIHIGGWLRNIYTFYRLSIPTEIAFNNKYIVYDNIMNNNFNLKSLPQLFKKKRFPLKKTILKGKHMNNYFPNDTFVNNLINILINNSHENNIKSIPNCSTNEGQCGGGCSGIDTNITNNWNKHFYQDIQTIINSVDIINHIDNKSYDNLLKSNIVFLNLVDASACNTLIECIARNTPIVINKIPSVVELLGEKYPLYYQNLNEIKSLINDKKIYSAYTYLKSLDKKPLNISYFMSQFINTIKLILMK